ncbi:hypothetical protein PASE110613_09125 [Paenibacillus sediminis]|uniref:Uncharacterized protein n=1 Tax=Paenibacillus sediminis TaxID=664909 RepID=A0ABS4H6P3_9BACL|nr:hypothetical protein [Paenibacillus sediminis]MBP1938192.1 hypothetical protein [Paenibacillus sediminis]
MAISVALADFYINANCIDIDDWTDADTAKKQRILNVAENTLTRAYSQYTIPDEAVYEFSNTLVVAFNDTNKLAQQGLTGFTVDKVGSFNFKDAFVNGVGADLRKFIPQSALDLIGDANGVTLSKRATKWVTM